MNKYKLMVLLFGFFLMFSSNVNAGNINVSLIINGDGTTSDLSSGLMWKTCSEGSEFDSSSCTGEGNKVPMGAFATDYAGYSDWRLPTVFEIETLVVCKHPASNALSKSDLYNGCAGDYFIPTIDLSYFPNSKAVRYWTATSSSEGFYVNVSFYKGSQHISPAQDRHLVRLVRSMN